MNAQKLVHACTREHRIELNFPIQFNSLLKVFSIAEISLDLPATACLLNNFGFWDRMFGYTIISFALLVLMALPTVWSRF